MRILLSLAILFVIGCTDSSDSQVTGGEFTVHFADKKDYKLAKSIVEFWKKDSLMTGEPQDVRLKRTNDGYDLLLISTGLTDPSDLTFEDLRSLDTLQERLQARVFHDERVSLVIADKNFKPLFRPKL